MKATCINCGHDLTNETTIEGMCWWCDSDRKWGAGDQRCNDCGGPWRRNQCENCKEITK